MSATAAPDTIAPEPVRFGTFAGVYRPVVLTVLGAMFYLREGWLVGNAGLLGALGILVASYVITGTTALSVSSIATNLRVKAGGAFAIIAAALGLEAGGAIGIPLYIAQTVSSVMYLYAFTEGWGYLFPTHRPGVVVVLAFAAVGAIVLRSSSLASRAQAVMLGVVAVAISSAFLGWSTATPQRPQLFGSFPEASLLEGFAIFFPAATGIMVGAGMSGSLARPTHAIPRGTMAAWATTFVVYAMGAVWYATVVPREELLTNKLAMADHALFGPAVLFGLLSSTLMAALSSLVAAPRLLAAMADHDIVPSSAWVRAKTEAGEPRNATLVTLGIAALGLLAGSLDAIAPVITSFFIMTFLAINVVVATEQSLGLISWRPTFAIPTAVPLVGVAACLTTLVLCSPAGGLPEVMFVLGIHIWLSWRKQLDTPWETVQSGIAQSVASWAALKAAQMVRSERTWKPDVLVPVGSTAQLNDLGPLAARLTAHRGSVKLVALAEDPALHDALDAYVDGLRARGHFASWHGIDGGADQAQTIRLVLDAMQGTFFAPNLLLLAGAHHDQPTLQALMDHARERRVGIGLLIDTPGADGAPAPAPGAAVWLSDRSPDWELTLHVANLDLPVLLGYLITRAGKQPLYLHTVLRDEAARPDAAGFLDDLVELGRLPNATPIVHTGAFLDRLRAAPPAGLHLLGLAHGVDLARMHTLREAAGAPCLFVQDSGQESAIA